MIESVTSKHPPGSARGDPSSGGEEAGVEATVRLVARARAGDRAAFDALVAAFTPLLLGFLLGKTADRADAEDVAQETWLTAWRVFPSLRRPERLGPWLMRIARRRLADFYRERGRRPQLVWNVGDEAGAEDRLARLADPGADPARNAQAAQLRSVVIESIAWMKDKYRMVLYLALFDECDAETIARRLGLRAGTVRMRLHRGLKLLRRALRRQGVNRPESE
jgi:RNA polymerase sigma-70 factor (ECF subfamily)